MGTRACGSEISMSRPSVGEAGNTGDWRNARPVMDPALCLAVKQDKVTCQICWAYCPDACIARGVGPVIDLTYCKGCGICAEECPAGAIAMVPESEHGSCELDAAAEVAK
ncbi:MAG: 4Fe-4S binding protein [Coriobacteriia bacterium]|nr:4Fe-4S binding protein [Coriobacteriia bacterium]